MGIYTGYWKAYMHASKMNALRLMGLLIFGLPATAAISYVVGTVTGEYPALLQVGLPVVVLAVFTVQLLRATKIVCPRCSTAYAHSKWQRQCPSCALAILQDDP